METNRDEVNGLLTVTDVAELLRLKPGTVYQKVARRELPYLKLGQQIRFRVEDVEAYLQQHFVKAIG